MQSHIAQYDGIKSDMGTRWPKSDLAPKSDDLAHRILKADELEI